MSTSLVTSPSRRPVNALIGAWAFLMALSGLSFWLGNDHGVGASTATAAVLAVAFVKVYLVGRYFMELGHSARRLEALFAAWCFSVGTLLVVLALAL